MATLVADTHALVWHLTDPDRLGKAARRALATVDTGRGLCHVPVIVLVEICFLYERGRLRMGPSRVLDALGGHPGYAVLALDVEQVIEFGALTSVRDPVDRLILSAARVTGSRLVSADASLGGHGVERVWN
ncbi:MAG: type II toxin-antitoxin system VapC family toxin [Candidatus Rokuibacteriota bacterium]